jgi:hypothetical protein
MACEPLTKACGSYNCPRCNPCRYPYTHHGPAVYGSKLADYLISEAHLREDRPELFAPKEPE